MIKHLPADTAPCIAEADLERLLATPEVQGFLALLDAEIPGLDLTVDRAVALGFLAAAAFREGRLDDHLRVGALTFDDREWADFCSAAIAFFEPDAARSELLDLPTEPPTDPDDERRA